MEKKNSEPESCKNEQNTQFNSKDEVLKELENNLKDFDPNCNYNLNGLKLFEALRNILLNEKDNNNNLLNNEDENKSSFLFEQYYNMNLKTYYSFESKEFTNHYEKIDNINNNKKNNSPEPKTTKDKISKGAITEIIKVKTYPPISYKKKKKQKKRCRNCGSADHLQLDCPTLSLK